MPPNFGCGVTLQALVEGRTKYYGLGNKFKSARNSHVRFQNYVVAHRECGIFLEGEWAIRQVSEQVINIHCRPIASIRLLPKKSRKINWFDTIKCDLFHNEIAGGNFIVKEKEGFRVYSNKIMDI